MSVLSISANVNTTVSGASFNDIYLDRFGNISLSVDLQAVLENCAQAASTRLGEEVFNVNEGIPYFDTLFSGVPRQQPLNAALRAAWLAVNGVLEVVSLMTDQVGNTFTYTAVIRTAYGTGGISGSI